MQSSVRFEGMEKSAARIRTAMFEFSVDLIVWMYTVWCTVRMWTSALLTVHIDAFGMSRRPIKTATDKFTVECEQEFERRVVAWFYREHAAPDDDDWRKCLTQFGLTSCPNHTLVLSDGRNINVSNIVLRSAESRGSRSVQLVGSEPHNGPTPLGGLAPTRLIKDAQS